MSQIIPSIEERSFDSDVLKCDIPVLICFSADWNLFCRVMNPILEETSKSYGGRVKICKMNIDDNAGTVKYNVREVPTLALFKYGGLAATRKGPFNNDQVATFLNSYV